MLPQNQYWYFLIGGPTDEASGTVANFYAYGEHCGEALARASQAAREDFGIIAPEASEAARLDTLNKFQEPEDLIQLTDFVLCGANSYSYPLGTDAEFIPPVGIIKSTDDGEFEYDLIKNCFLATTDAEAGFEFELVADKSKLLDAFMQALTLISAPESIGIRIHGHWHDEQSELWKIRTEHLKTDAKEFFRDNQANLLENGFVECIISIDSTSTHLTLTEHKKILFQTKDQELFNSFGYGMIDLGFEQTKELFNLEYGFYHWHYRPAESLDAPELRLLLLDTGFAFIKRWNNKFAE